MTAVTLTAAMRANLLSLQNTATLMGATQFRLATGLKVNSALDNPASFFAAQGLNNRAGDLASLLDGMGQSVQTLKAADEGIKGLTTLVNQAKAVAQEANSRAVGDDVSDLATSYTDLLAQIDSFITDTGYHGVNLLNGDTLTTQFNEDNSSTQDVTGVTYDAAGLGLTTGAAAFGAGGVKVQATVDGEIDNISAALTDLRNTARDFGNSLSVIQTRQDFTANLVNVLKDGASALTIADKNEEAANMLSLQTSQQLGIQALSLASQANQSVLRLFQ
jgi:flagellin-like hook-associated protein FlgL